MTLVCDNKQAHIYFIRRVQITIWQLFTKEKSFVLNYKVKSNFSKDTENNESDSQAAASRDEHEKDVEEMKYENELHKQEA